MLSLEEARQQILSRIAPRPSESLALGAAHGRYLAEDLIAPIDLPSFDNSAMDGYAVRAADTAGAALDQPVSLRLAGRSVAGEPQPGSVTVGPGHCLRIFTGAPLPPGADAVIMQEDTRVDPIDPNRICLHDVVKPWENVRFRGEDVRQGALILSAGDRLSAGRIGLAAAVGCVNGKVGPRPRVALLATGNELVEPGQALVTGQIYESNRAMLAPLMLRAGAAIQIRPLVGDALRDTKEALSDAFHAADIVVTSGGVSVGELDFVKPAFQELGGRLEVWRVAIKPGKPFAFGELHGKFLFGLPGNPVSALVTFLLLVRPALLRWQGATSVELPARLVRAGEEFENFGGRRHFVRARLDASGQARSAGTQASHLLGSLAAADGLLDLPAGARITAGDPVTFVAFDD
jgi:molybdopterin molybdotransferase